MRTLLACLLLALHGAYFEARPESPDGKCAFFDFSKYPDRGPVKLRGKLYFVQTEQWPSGRPGRSYYQLTVPDGCFFEVTAPDRIALSRYVDREVEVSGEMTSPRKQWLTIVVSDIQTPPRRHRRQKT